MKRSIGGRFSASVFQNLMRVFFVIDIFLTDRFHKGLNSALSLLILSFGVGLPLIPLVNNPLHPDEALYTYWGRLIASGQDPMLNTVAVDKPPLFIYLIALCFRTLGEMETVARLPSYLAHLLTINLTFRLGKILYSENVGLLAALITSLSPFSILFAATAFTDPPMIAFIMLSAWAAATQKSIWAGLSLGLAAATKQQGIFFIPLILMMLIIPLEKSKPKISFVTHNVKLLWPCLIVLIVCLALPLLWDMNRTYSPGFWLQSSLSYGGLTTAIPHFSNRLGQFIALLHLVTASQILNIIFIVGLSVCYLFQFQWRGKRQNLVRMIDWVFISFCSSFLLLHAGFTFQIWDRYLLGLVPFLSLLLARILHLPALILKSSSITITTLIISLVLALMMPSARLAANNGYPLGGDHKAFSGVAEIATYLRSHVGANVTLYHRWLGTHWRYYLFGFPYDLRFWQSAEDLSQQAKANEDSEQYIAFPAWQSTTSANLGLSDVGLSLTPIYRTFRPDGGPAVVLYKIESIAQ